MFSMPFCRSIGIHALLVIVFGITEFPVYGNSIPANETCVNVSGEMICYFKGSEKPLAWNAAKRLCNSFNSTLTVIRNINDQDAVAGYLQSLADNTAAWTAGKKVGRSNWTWIKYGEQLKKFYQAESNDEIKFTNWDSNVFSRDGQCISIDASDGKWKAVGCKELKRAVCQKGQSVSSTETSVEDIPTKEESFISFFKESTTYGSQGFKSQSSLFAVVGVGIVIIICIIVIIVFVLRSRKRPGSEIGHSKFNNNSPQNHYEELDSRITTVSVNEPANDPVERSDDNRDDYAEIRLSTLDQSGDGATNQQPGIVYASLECKNEPTNLEPDNKPIHSPTKIGPLGDIYAMPDPKGHAVTSPGNASCGFDSHPIIVTAKGDIYALPRRTSQSPTANHQVDVVYANLQNEMLGKELEAVEHVQTKDIGHSKFNSRSPQNNREKLDRRITNAPVNTSVSELANTRVNGSDNIRGVYAETALSTLNQSEYGTTYRQPGMVNASLECKNEPRNLEPDNKPIHSPTKIGPLGDIYAIPDAKGQAVTFPGNISGGSDSHPIIVTAKGDIYALPMKTSKSPTSTNPGEIVYANLQAET